MTQRFESIGPLAAWVLAIRPPTLTAAVVPVVVGTALAARAGVARGDAAAAALVAALLIQIGTNLANDVDDFQRGADSGARQGPLRVVQAGLLSPIQVRRGAWGAFGAAGLVGLYLCACAGWPIALVGAMSIVSGLAYTGGPWPLGYHGLGDVFVFVFFGVVAVAGTFYVQTRQVSALAFACAVPVGALVTTILVINNVRDADGDRLAGKRTLAVRFGPAAGRAECLALMLAAYAAIAVIWWRGAASVSVLLPWLTVPWAIRVARQVVTCRSGACLNQALKSAARLHGAFGLLFAAGLLV